MRIDIKPYIVRIREHLKSDDINRLCYAYLELRYAMEYILNEKIRFHHNRIYHEDHNKWRPKELLNILSSIDNFIEYNATTRIWQNNKCILKNKTGKINPKEYKRLYHKLGSYLHEKSRNVNCKKTKSHIEDVIIYLEKIVGDGCQFSILLDYIFYCLECKYPIPCGIRDMKNGKLIRCFREECNSTHEIVLNENNVFTLRLYKIEIECKKCETENIFNADKIWKLDKDRNHTIKCIKCDTQFFVTWNANIHFIEKED